MKYILILAALVPLAGCVTKSKMLKNMGDQKAALEDRCVNSTRFDLAVQESLIVEQCNQTLEQQQIFWEVNYCLLDKKMADALAVAHNRSPRYIPQCAKILKGVKIKNGKAEREVREGEARPTPVAPTKDYSSGKR